MKRIIVAALALLLPLPALAASQVAPNIVFPPSYGALFNGTTDDAAALQKALTAASAAGQGLVQFPPNLTTLSNSGLTYNQDLVRMDCNGSAMDFRGLATGTALTVTTTMTDPTTGNIGPSTHPITNCVIRGPNTGTGVIGFTFPSVTLLTEPWAQGKQFDDLAITGFDVAFQFGSGVFDYTWNRLMADNTNAVGTGVVFEQAGISNSGEEMRVNDSWLTPAHGVVLWDKIGNANSDWDFVSVSMDGVGSIVAGGSVTPGTGAAAAIVNLNGGHVENWVSPTNGAYLVWTGGYFRADGTRFFESGAPDTIFRTDGVPQLASQSHTAGIVLRDTAWDGGFYNTLPNYFFVDGSGPVSISGTQFLGTTNIPMLAQGNNLIPNFAFPSSASITGVWTMGTGATAVNTSEVAIPAIAATATNGSPVLTAVNSDPVVARTNSLFPGVVVGDVISDSAACVPSGTTVAATSQTTITLSANASCSQTGDTLGISNNYSIELNSSGSVTSTAKIDGPCAAGSYAGAKSLVVSAGITGGGSFVQQLNFLDKSGNVIGLGQSSTRTTNAAYAPIEFATGPAPAGTNSVQLLLENLVQGNSVVSYPMLACY